MSGGIIASGGAGVVDEHSTATEHSSTIADHTTPTAISVSSTGSETTEGIVFNHDETTGLSFFAMDNDKSRVGEQFRSTSMVNGKTSSKIRIFVGKREDTAGSLGTYYVRVRNSAGSVKGTFGSDDASNLSTSGEWVEFTGYTWTIEDDDWIGVEYTGYNSGVNYVKGYYKDYGTSEASYDGSHSRHRNYDTSWNHAGAWDHPLQIYALDEASAIDDNTGTQWVSNAEVNPYCYVDCGGSNINLVGIALYLNSNTTETEIKIQSSTDASTWTDLRTISVSNMTASSWNYIRFNLAHARYLRVYGNSGSSVKLGFNEIKYYTQTDDDIFRDFHPIHIDPTDTSLGLDGT